MPRLSTMAFAWLACVGEAFYEPEGSTDVGVRRAPGAVTVETNGVISNELSETAVRRQSRKQSEILGSLPSSSSSSVTSRKLKVAVVFRGESFRAPNNPDHLSGRRAQYGAHKRRTCEDNSLDAQGQLVKQHNELLAKIAKLVDVDVFGVTYACRNGMDYANRLSDMVVPKMKALDILPKERSLQLTTMAHALRMAVKTGRETGKRYDGIYLLRWDYLYNSVLASMNRSACWADALPRDLNGFTTTNADGLIYVPGAHAEEMLAFMELDASPCCGPPCVQGCSECIVNFMKHLGKSHANSCHPCQVVNSPSPCGSNIRSLGEEIDEPLDVDEVWCKGTK